MKVKIKCTKCGWEALIEVETSPLGSLKPDTKSKGAPRIKIKWKKDQLDKIMEAGLGASREELGQIGIHIPIPQWTDAAERRKLRKFIKEHLRVCKDKRKTQGEKSQVSTAPWQMGDSFKDVDLGSSEVKSLGVDDLRLIPGVTLQKRVYETTKGQDIEVLKGIKFFNIIDVSGSMFGTYNKGTNQIDKVHKALMMAEEIYKLCKKLGYDYHVAIFSDRAERIPQRRTRQFFADEDERAKYGCWNGGTTLSSALEEYDLKELKDGNLVIMSDMDISDFAITQAKFLEIASVTNSFKVVLIEYKSSLSASRIKKIQELFPNKKVEILQIPISN